MFSRIRKLVAIDGLDFLPDSGPGLHFGDFVFLIEHSAESVLQLRGHAVLGCECLYLIINETSEQELRLCRMEFVDGEFRSLLYGLIRHNADQLPHGI